MPYPKFGDGPGLLRVAAVARRLGIDLPAFGANGAVIVGSNGKGSTAAMCAAALEAEGASVGLFTSPHLFALNERMRIDGEDIGDEELQRCWARVQAGIEAENLGGQFGGFEFLFLLAADWFAARKVVHTVWEAGIGGRLDPVRLIAARRVALTSLDLEHTALLGDTLDAIAREKIDAAPEGATLFFGPTPIDAAIEAYCAERGITARLIAPAPRAPLVGEHQRVNAGLALALARDMGASSAARLDAALACTRWPARLEALQQAPLVVIDAGHTPRAIESALQGFIAQAGERPRVLVCGASADKPWPAMIGALAPAFPVIVCAAARHKGAPAAAIAAVAAQAHAEAEIIIADSLGEARSIAIERAGANGAVYAAGGLFLAAEFRALHFGRDPAAIAFF